MTPLPMFLWPKKLGNAWVGPPPSGSCPQGGFHRWVSSRSVQRWQCVSCGILREEAP